MPHASRRDFLKLAASVGGAVIANEAKPLYVESQVVSGSVRAWRTTAQEKFQPVQSPPQWETGVELSPLAIYLEPATSYQKVLGFGGAFTDASCYLLHLMEPDARHAFLSDLFGSSGLRLSVGRTCIVSSDFSTKMHSYDDTPEPDPELKHFSIEQDQSWIVPTLREAQHINPDLYLFSSVWSPPGWMKSGGSMLGGCMKERWFGAHAQYFVKFIQAYADAGIKVKAVTVNNEVDTDQDGHFPATIWAQQHEMVFVALHLGPALEKASLETRIWILDHNYNLWGRVADELSDPRVARYVDGVAWHSYIGTPDAMSRIHEMFPDKHMYFTEGGPPAHLFGPSEERHQGQPPRHDRPAYGTDWTRWSNSFTGMLRNWARCICVWNLLLDENGGPTSPIHHVPYAAMDLSPSTRKPKNSLTVGTTSLFHTTRNLCKEEHVFLRPLEICRVSTMWRPRTRIRAACWCSPTATTLRDKYNANSVSRSSGWHCRQTQLHLLFGESWLRASDQAGAS